MTPTHRRFEADGSNSLCAVISPANSRAAAVGVTVPTIRHWTKEGLLEVAELTESGYQLYAPEMKTRCEEIKALKEQRLTLGEIKERF